MNSWGLPQSIFCCVASAIAVYNPAFAVEKPKLSLVIDDLGYSLNYGQQAFDLMGEHTYAIIPNTLFADKLSLIAQKSNKEVIMHLPMQSNTHKSLQDKNTLNDGMSKEKLIATTLQFLKKMPHISGINNHMGSHLTQYEFFMRPLMETIYKHNPKLYFLDSRTSANSMAYDAALKSGLRASKRNVFLDHSEAPADIRYQFNHWLRKARKGYPAVAIAHPTRSTLEVIKPLLEAEQQRYQFVTLSHYLADNPTQVKKPKWPSTHLSLLHKDAKISKPLP